MKPNIVLITVDCWRGDHLGVAQNAKVETPNIDAIAKQSHYFDHAYSSGGWTKIAMKSLFSSNYASMHGFDSDKYNPERPNLAKQLQTDGYHTAGYTTNLVCGKSGGFDLGFDEFNDLRPVHKQRNRFNSGHRLEQLACHPRLGPALGKFAAPYLLPFYPTTDANELIDVALDWLSKPKASPFFLWLHFMDLHWPYRSSKRALDSKEFTQMWLDRRHWKKVRASQGRYYPGNQRAQRWQQLYAEEVQTLDAEIGRFTTALSKRNDWENTALCITSDHGEEFYEHGTWAHSWNQLHDEGIHVPLILKTPNQTQASINSTPVSHLDIAPTLLEIAEITPPPKMLGSSLLNSKPHEQINSEMFGHRDSHLYRLSIRHDGYHYLYDGGSNSCFLYATKDDKENKKNLYNLNCGISKKFDRLRLAHISQGALDMLKKKVVIGEDETSFDLDDDPAVIARLQALGYMD